MVPLLASAFGFMAMLTLGPIGAVLALAAILVVGLIGRWLVWFIGDPLDALRQEHRSLSTPK